jgi:outer membrane beta-barrel protein
METWIRVLLLTPLLTLGLQGCGLFGGSKPEPLGSETEAEPEEATVQTVPAGQTGQDASEQPVIDPRVERRRIKTPSIDSSDLQLGLFVGVLSIEDFGSGSVIGARLDYHVTEEFFLEGTVGRSKGGQSSFELGSGGPQVLTNQERYYTYYAINAGWNALPGEVFTGRNQAYNSAFYFTIGMGGTKFGGDNRFTLNAGMGYRVLTSRNMAVNFDFRDHMFDIDVLGEKKVAHNLEGSLGLSVFF